MNLKAKIHVERQKAAVQEKLDAHLALLKDKGLEDGLIERDATLRRLRAQVAKANSRLARIAAQKKLNQERAQAKIDKRAAEKAEPEKKEKKAKKETEAKPKGKQKAKKGE